MAADIELFVFKKAIKSFAEEAEKMRHVLQLTNRIYRLVLIAPGIF